MINQKKKQILDIIFQHIDPDSCVIFLFGSHASGEALLDSDVDIGILGCDEIPPKDFLEVQEALNSELPWLRKVDFVDFSTVDAKVRKEALKEIQIWHVGKSGNELLKSLKQA